jgi:hypothetical protein
MTEPVFRPRSATEIVDAAVKIYRDNLAPLVTISLVLLVPFYVLGMLLGTVGALVAGLGRALMTPIVVAMIVGAVDDALHGRPVDTSSALDRVRGRAGLLIGIAFAQGILTFLGFVLLIIPGLLAMVWTFAAPMTVVVENVGDTGTAFSRARALARGQFGHVLGTLLLAYLAVIFVTYAFSFIVGFVGVLVHVPVAVLGLIASAVFAALFPVVAVASALLYFDLRVRNEAYDVESLVSELPNDGVGAGPGAPTSGAAPRPGSRTL